MKNIVLETDRVIMKSPLGVADKSDILRAINHTDTLRFLSSVPFDYTEEVAESFLGFLKSVEDSDKVLQLGIFEKEKGSFIGMMTLEEINYDEKTCELGYWLSKDFTGKGLASESAKGMIDFAFSSLGMKKIKAYVIKEHEKSISLLERMGFIQQELLLNNEENKGIMVDRYLYVLE